MIDVNIKYIFNAHCVHLYCHCLDWIIKFLLFYFEITRKLYTTSVLRILKRPLNLFKVWFSNRRARWRKQNSSNVQHNIISSNFSENLNTPSYTGNFDNTLQFYIRF